MISFRPSLPLDGDGAVELAETENVIQLHGLAGADVVDDDAVLDGINDHVRNPFPVIRCPAA